jgi:4-amino-4-deoxy-L-arabinose transferase-like glycosyltransferase
VSNLEPVQRRVYIYVALFTMFLYAAVLAVGGPLTMHEGVLSQTTKAMLANHDWLAPRYGDAPWLERPPLPQWISCGICVVLGHCNQEWNMRIGPALAGLTTVLLTVWLAGRLFGRGVGILSGLALATMYNFVRYSTLAEADIFLAPIVAAALCAFAYTEILQKDEDGRMKDESRPDASVSSLILHPSSFILHPSSFSCVGKRPWGVLCFFVLLGMTNLAKGLVFGTVIAMAPIVVYLLWNARRQNMMIFFVLFGWAILAKWLELGNKQGLGTAVAMGPLGLFLLWNVRLYARYLWLWGWLAFAGLALPWPILIYQRYPDAIDVWRFDLFGRLTENYLGEPVWYYFECLTWVPQPWSIAAFIGMGLTFRKAWHEGSPAHRFVWCWAWMPLLVFSLSHGKHHHYMLHYLAPWAIFAAHAVVWGWEKVAGWKEEGGRMKDESEQCSLLSSSFIPHPSWFILHPSSLIPLVLVLSGEILLAVFAHKLSGPPWLMPALMTALPLFVASLWWFSLHRKPVVALIGSFALLFVLYGSCFWYKGAYLNRSLEDTAFLHEVRRTVPLDQPLMLNSADEALEGLRMQFYIGDTVYFLHNLSFVLDDRIHTSDVYVVTRYKRLPELNKYGHAEPLLKCKQARRETSEADRWTLFRLHLRDDLPRKSAAVRISPMQAMYRTPGPTLD